MGRKRGKRRNTNPPSKGAIDTPSQANSKGVHFELEEDADELLKAFIDQDSSLPEEADEAPSQNQKRPKNSDKVTFDCHGMGLEQAKQLFRTSMEDFEMAYRGQPLTVRVITGKGRRSAGLPVMAKDFYDWVRSAYRSRITSIQASPMDSGIDGVLLRGHFDVVFRF